MSSSRRLRAIFLIRRRYPSISATPLKYDSATCLFVLPRQTKKEEETARWPQTGVRAQRKEACRAVGGTPAPTDNVSGGGGFFAGGCRTGRGRIPTGSRPWTPLGTSPVQSVADVSCDFLSNASRVPPQQEGFGFLGMGAPSHLSGFRAGRGRLGTGFVGP